MEQLKEQMVARQNDLIHLKKEKEKELQAIKKYFSSAPATSPEQIYESLHRARKNTGNTWG